MESFAITLQQLIYCAGLTGTVFGHNLYTDTNDNVLISGKNSRKYLNNQVLRLPIRGHFQYNSLPYKPASHITEKSTGSP